MRTLALPLESTDLASLSVGEMVGLSGVLFMGREPSLRHLLSAGQAPFVARGSFLLLCGAQLQRVGSRWEARTAAPEETSTIEPLIGELLGRLGFSGVIGRGGAGTPVLAACRRYGGIYLQTIGGAGLALARRIQKVRESYFKDQFDARDCIWEIEVGGFPAIVTMDSHGRSLHDIVRDVSSRRLAGLVS